ncbi:bifunctional diaminohydroxyphosphoribosylaminopyrimidine deaminase/5-amino-6-(5-phosphoribosylamino)uracil reductase RibD [Hydrogenimonas sp.]
MNRYDLAMALALEEAWRFQFLTYPNPAVGAAIVGPCGEIVAVAAHREAGGPHAEVRAIRDAYVALTGDVSLAACEDASLLHQELAKRAGQLFCDKTIVVTLEPCNHTGRTPPCASLIERLKFGRVVIGVQDPNPQAAGGAERLRKAGIEVVTGVREAACEVLLAPFVRWRDGTFYLFKLAQSLNGVVDGGTISCEESRRWVHTLRTRVDTLLIGGGTVRCDRPRLDSRLVGGRAPDVAIFTRKPESIDPSIPLFSVPGRRVTMGTELPEKGLVLVEGGPGTLEAMAGRIDWMVLFVAPFSKEGLGYNVPMRFTLRHQCRSGEDAMLFLERK